MGKKKNNETKQQPQPEKQQEEQQTEGKFLLGKPKFKKLENGRYKCVQTGHELPADSRESYSQTKHCRLGLIDYALARNKPPLNMFNQDPLCRSKLICKLTGHTVNKTEEHIWKHINGKRFLNMLVRNPEEQDSDAEEEEFWMPPVGDRWDFDDGKDRWGSDFESDVDPENDDADEDVAGDGEEENNEAQELSKRTKRMSIEIEPSELASKKKKKTQST
ncbi:hypothetical protein M8C21_033652 [Ambrosia artemisiifolia]|uniref:Surfeit locus protein 2 n=1 Tax=Ambrosia artemisiifolia TaxID=4212 RepID=A0AAD5CRQ5_AMBAR|nr:hypothetical protein M8C21_033652 [Ambrosia artemisiifolia]